MTFFTKWLWRRSYESVIRPCTCVCIHVHRIIRFPTVQLSLGHLSDLYLVKCVPLVQFRDNLWLTIYVFCSWFTPMHLFRTVYKSQVLLTENGSEKIVATTKKASFCVTVLLWVSLVRESTFQEITGLLFCYCCMVVLWSGWHRSGVLHHTWWRLYS